MIGYFSPPTKICHFCGYRSYELTLKDRKCKYPSCKIKYNIDINAAINIKKFSPIDQNLIEI